MRYFFRRKIPDAADVLLIESGSPDVARRALERIRTIFPSARYHLCTCHLLPPEALFATVYQASEYPTGWQKLNLVLSFCRRGWSVLVILCTGEPILWRWKMLALLLMPAKVLVVNEHADFFWLDWGHRRTLRKLAGIRWGVNLEDICFTTLRALVFPLTFFFLLASAGFLYLRRARRLLWWKLKATSAPASRHAQPVCAEPRQARER
ncbi:MAG: hypothetical protein HYX72_15265 [Acidobacteria bacterium]|nr:hypothetical protein [Acidobacteriota bacterium]